VQTEKPTAALDAFLANFSGMNMINTPADIRFYPNPCTGGLLNFEFAALTGSHDVRIFDITGRLMRQQKLTGSFNDPIHLDLLPGLYLVNVDGGPNALIGKLVVR